MSPTGWVLEQFIPSWWCYLGRYGRLRWGSLGISAWGWGSEVLYPSPLSICPLLPDYRHNVTRASPSCCMQCLQCLCQPDCTLGLWAKITLLSLSCFCRVISYSNKKTNKKYIKEYRDWNTGGFQPPEGENKIYDYRSKFSVVNGTGFGTFPKGKRHSRWLWQPWGPSLLLLVQAMYSFNSTSQAFIILQPRAARI